MDFSYLFEKLGLSDKTLATLKNVAVFRPQYNQKDESVFIKLGNDEFLPAEMYFELKRALEDYLEAKVDIQLEVKNSDVSVITLSYYIDEYYKLVNKSNSIIPVMDNGRIYINLPLDEFDEITKMLKLAGVKNQFVRGSFTADLGEDRMIIPTAPFESTTTTARSKFTKFEDYPYMQMNKLSANNRKVKIIGKVVSSEIRNGKSKKSGKPFEIETVILTDYTDAITIKRFNSDRTPKNIALPFKQGMIVAGYGVVKYDSYDNTNVFEPDYLDEVAIDPFVTNEEYEGEERRIELHAHTNRSEYDGVSSTKEIINRAYKLGQKAIAITDTSVVQAYPLAQQAHVGIGKDKDFKVIYGIDVKMVDDLHIVHNATDQLIKGSEFVVFDLETTGLSTKYDHIIEFGGVIVRNNVITNERLQMFVKPPVPIPPFIEQKTNITNEMVKNALPIEQAIDKMLEFIGDRVMVAHNADFDYNFINDTLEKLGRKRINNICLDTLNLARQVVKNSKYYRLGIIAKKYGVEYDEETAHRGDYDAEVLANVLIKMLPDIPDYENVTYKMLQENQDENNFKKAHTYNCVLLAKNMDGIKKIYEIVTLSHTKYLNYFAKEGAKKADGEIPAEPRILKSEIEKRRSELVIGSSDQYSELFEIALNRSLRDLEECMKFYDYVEINPLDSYRNLIEEGTSVDQDRIKMCITDIINVADKLGKPVVASANVFYAYSYQKQARDVYIMGKRIGGIRHPLYPYNREKRRRFVAPDAHLMTTKEMMDAFQWTGRAKEFVIDNTIKVSDMIDRVFPIATELKIPSIPNCEEMLRELVYRNAHNKYGEQLPEIVEKRIEKELVPIIKFGNSVQYWIAHLLVKQSNEEGYPVGSRGSVGSSFVATMADITEVNPLVPHYVCPHCKHSEFFENNEYPCGFDMPEKNCPVCGTPMTRDGHNIPFETFLGFNGDKVPDIDLNFSAENQGAAQLLVRDLFGAEYSYRAGTIGTVAEKTAFGYVKGYCEELEIPNYSPAYMQVLASMCSDVKRTTGQHPGGIVVIPKEYEVHDFSPIQYPANNPFADWYTTHFAFADLHDNVLKLDILGHVDPTAIRYLSLFTGVPYYEVPMGDKKVLSIFNSTEALDIKDRSLYKEENGAVGLPEFGTHNNRRILNQTRPDSFFQLVNLEGVTHGTDVWANNAEVLIQNGTCTLSEVISCRDDIMSYLISKGMPSKMSFDIMEKVRKGKGLTAEWIQAMKDHDVPDWYINSCQLIKYMFPKAHAVAYAMNAVRMAWYKVYYPAAYYAVYFSIRCDAYDIETMIAGKMAIYNKLKDIQDRIAKGEKVTNKEETLESVLEVALEMHLRGYHFSNISLDKSEAVLFTVDKDDPYAVVPAFNSIDGLGDAVARSIVEQRSIRPFISKEDFLKRTSVNNTQLAFMSKLGVLDDLSNENQLSLF